MTNEKYRQSVLSRCSMAAQDCKGSADYAAYAFGHDDEEKGREYVRNLEANLSRLKAEMSSLDYVNRKIKDHGPDSTE
jgi:ABC-type Fe3+ transport system substrate-binding protein